MLAVLGSGTLSKILSIGAVCAAGLMLSGCGNSLGKTLDDTLGLSKEVPDERVVRTHQTLAVPPDLQLRPPAAGETVTGTLNPAAQQAANQRTYATPPSAIGTQVVPPAGTAGKEVLQLQWPKHWLDALQVVAELTAFFSKRRKKGLT